MSVRFTFTETMTGLHHFVDPKRGDANDRRFYFRLEWGPRDLSQLSPFGHNFLTFEAEGVIFVDGLTDGEVPCTGSLAIDYFGRRTITYALEFEVKGERFRFVGEKVDVNLLNPLMLIKTHTTCYGTLLDETGTIVSRSVAHFEPSSLISFLTSFRLQLR